jgi:enoyl-CoA hydratase
MAEDQNLVCIEYPAAAIVRLVLNRPERANAQSNELLYALNAALTAASRDEAIKVIILAGAGRHFCSGHDLGSWDPTLSTVSPIGVWGGFGLPAQEGYMAFEEEAYFGLCWRWRNIPKPVIAEVQGKTIAAGLMLAWICDIIVASEDATFTDPVVAAGANGVEYFAHPWELSPRKAKEMLFTGQGMSAKAACVAGMINRVVPLARLKEETLEMAKIIAEKPSMGLKLAKLSVNQVQDEQGFYSSLRAAMAFQHLFHAQQWALHGKPGDPTSGERLKRVMKLPLLPDPI